MAIRWILAIFALAACTASAGEPERPSPPLPERNPAAMAAAALPTPAAPSSTTAATSVSAPASAVSPGRDTADAAVTAPAPSTPSSNPSAQEASSGYAIPPSAQRPGDPAQGYRLIVGGDYVGCGLPIAAQRIAFLLAPPASAETLPERAGSNAELPYYLTAFMTDSGVEVVSNNCLLCHAARLNGKLVIGLGATTGDSTNPTSIANLAAVRDLLFSEAEQREFDKWFQRMSAVTPFLRTATLGANPADRVADILFAHRDPETLAWSAEPRIPLTVADAPPADVPPWWRIGKKNSLYHSGIGRGDQARLMMTTSAMCTDTVAEAQAVDDYFPHVRAYIASLSPPRYPEPVDAQLAHAGEAIFVRTCARCHGTYGAEETYPNLLIPIAQIGTDPAVALGGQYTQSSIAWFNRSFYGQRAQLVLDGGYVAPPLDGIWATAPFLHNGSVPTLSTLLESSKRPTHWTRSFADDGLDYTEMGFRYQRLATGQAAEPDAEKRKRIYDTTLPGYGNGGHTFGDALTVQERASLIEYLKTL